MRAGCSVLALALLATLTAFAAKPSQSTEIADNAAQIAASRFAKDAEDETGRQLVAFALALDADNDRALKLQASLERGQAIEEAPAEADTDAFVALLEGAAAKTRSKPRALLYYRVIQLVEPTHDKAAAELGRARNQGTDTEFAALLRGLRAKDTTKAADDGAATKDVLDALGAVSFNPVTYSSGMMLYDDPLRIVNDLNSQLRAAGLAIRVKSKTRAVTGEAEGGRLMSSAFHSRNYRLPTSQGGTDPLVGMAGDRVLLLVCALHDLGWQQEGTQLTLVDTADATGPDSAALLDARALATQAKKSQVDLINTYRRKELYVTGLVSGLGKGSPRYVHLAGDQVRVVLAAKAPEEAVHAMSDLYDEVLKAERGRRGNDDDEAAPAPRALLFVGKARFDGITGGRIMLKGCEDFAFLRTSPVRQN